MEQKTAGNVATLEIDYVDCRWMIQLAQRSRSAKRIILKNFEASVVSTAFVSRISAEARLEVVSWDNDLVLAKIC